MAFLFFLKLSFLFQALLLNYLWHFSCDQQSASVSLSSRRHCPETVCFSPCLKCCCALSIASILEMLGTTPRRSKEYFQVIKESSLFMHSHKQLKQKTASALKLHHCMPLHVSPRIMDPVLFMRYSNTLASDNIVDRLFEFQSVLLNVLL